MAATPDVSQVSNFIDSIIKILVSLAGLVATVFIVIGGFRYMTSSGNPELLYKAKRTIFYSAVGLAITLAAFVISNLVASVATNAFGG